MRTFVAPSGESVCMRTPLISLKSVRASAGRISLFSPTSSGEHLDPKRLFLDPALDAGARDEDGRDRHQLLHEAHKERGGIACIEGQTVREKADLADDDARWPARDCQHRLA